MVATEKIPIENTYRRYTKRNCECLKPNVRNKHTQISCQSMTIQKKIKHKRKQQEKKETKQLQERQKTVKKMQQ